MERRVAGIIRWLERCVKAYKDGAVESALMEAECARADIETLRGDLWRKLEGRHYARARRFNFFKTAEALFWALGIILITAAPLALQQDGSAGENRAEGHFTLEWVTPDEMELLSNLRRRPEDTTAESGRWTEDGEPVSAVKPEELIAEPRVASVRTAEPARRIAPEPPPLQQNEPETSLPYDRILSLIEAGERAMKNEAPAIRVENAK